MMKLCFSTLGCPEWSWEKILDEAQSMGFGGVEVRGVAGELDNERIALFWEPNLEGTVKSLKAHGLCVPCLDSSCAFLSAEASLAETIRAAKASVDIAQALGAPYIRVFGGRIPQGMGIGEQAAVAEVAEGLLAVASYADTRGVDVLLEAHGSFAGSRMLLSVLNRVKNPAAGVLWDVANPYEFGETVGVTWSRIGKFVRHVHIKDFVASNGGIAPCLPGRGRVPIGEAVSALGGSGYEGWLSFEWEKRWYPSIEGPETAFPAFLEQMRKYEYPKISAFI
jgi:sugar phosphate isomerase/epimerase